MSCTRMSDSLDRYADGALPAGPAADLEAHLAGCGACRDYLAGLDHLRRLLGREVVEPARAVDLSGLWPAIAARLPAEVPAPGAARRGAAVVPFPGGRGGRASRALSWPAGVAAAAAALVLLALALPIARFRAGAVDRAASIASVESDSAAQVIVLAGGPTEAPVIWVNDTADAPEGRSW